MLGKKVFSLPAPNRHNDIIREELSDDENQRLRRLHGFVQGFVDEKGLFLDRGAAAHRAIRCGQLTRPTSATGLHSEDLW
jgi:hypothetical protein